MGVKIDFEALIKPYSEPTEPDGTPRTPEGQRAWLKKKQVPEETIESAMQVVYARLSRGKKFDSGHELDRYLLHECVKQGIAKERALLRVQQTTLNKALKAAIPFDWPSASLWWVVGAMVGFFVGQWL